MAKASVVAAAPNGAGKVKGAPEKKSSGITLPKLLKREVVITLIGDSPLVCHRWSEKAKRQILDTQMKKGKQAKEAKNPEQDYLDSLYPHPDGGYGFPTLAFKAAAVDACSHIDGFTKVEARGSFHIMGDLVRIEGEPTPREDMVRVGMGTADIRFRGEFKDWKCCLHITYNANVISLEQLANLFETAGFAIGVGEHRPQKDGNWGMFHVAKEGEV